MIDNLPNDSDGDALRRLLATGSDLSIEMIVDFAVHVPDEASGLAVANEAKALGFQTDVERDDETLDWTCYCSRAIIPSYDLIILIQKQLNNLSRPFGGRSDGWGSFGNSGRP
jgi:hypothetical protein